MAYMNQVLKKEIVAEVKKVLPADWKVTFAVDNHNTIVMTVRSANTDLIQRYCGQEKYEKFNEYYRHYYRVNHYWYQDHCEDPELKEIVSKIILALNTKNWDNSDVMTDYFDVGYYVDLQFGAWNKPFVVNR